MERERISITFEVDLDPVPGTCHTLEYWVAATERDFQRFPYYNPKITNARVVKEAPTYMDQIGVMAQELIKEMYCQCESLLCDHTDLTGPPDSTGIFPLVKRCTRPPVQGVKMEYVGACCLECALNMVDTNGAHNIWITE